MHEEFLRFTDNLASKFEALVGQTPATNGVLPASFRGSGVYLFSENGKRLYVGRTRDVRKRYGEHTRPSSGDKKAPFAFKLARHATGFITSNYRPGEMSRAGLMLNRVFALAFSESLERVRNMEFRFIEEVDPTRQCLLEIYVSVVCRTPYNDFNTT
ncbi:GIY-YIG nuclease family protein [Mesorhizobium marinum]|uniref:GIY-YIG nuclease family protein n=1 Tax=Mesorhizobium marinum TaxID=3228790 RepID=A0ABV3R1A5_9HYPH